MSFVRGFGILERISPRTKTPRNWKELGWRTFTATERRAKKTHKLSANVLLSVIKKFLAELQRTEVASTW